MNCLYIKSVQRVFLPSRPFNHRLGLFQLRLLNMCLPPVSCFLFWRCCFYFGGRSVVLFTLFALFLLGRIAVLVVKKAEVVSELQLTINTINSTILL